MGVPPYQTVEEELGTAPQGGADTHLLDGAEVWARRRRPNYKFYILAALLYIIIDIPWLLLNAQNANNMVTAIQGKPLQFKGFPALPVYVALSFLVSRANVRVEAFVLGLCVYAVFDFTCLSMFESYSVSFAFADTLWGGTITTAVWSILNHPRVAKHVY